jgi:hypothetical protein
MSKNAGKQGKRQTEVGFHQEAASDCRDNGQKGVFSAPSNRPALVLCSVSYRPIRLWVRIFLDL